MITNGQAAPGSLAKLDRRVAQGTLHVRDGIIVFNKTPSASIIPPQGIRAGLDADKAREKLYIVKSCKPQLRAAIYPALYDSWAVSTYA